MPPRKPSTTTSNAKQSKLTFSGTDTGSSGKRKRSDEDSASHLKKEKIPKKEDDDTIMIDIDSDASNHSTPPSDEIKQEKQTKQTKDSKPSTKTAKGAVKTSKAGRAGREEKADKKDSRNKSKKSNIDDDELKVKEEVDEDAHIEDDEELDTIVKSNSASGNTSESKMWVDKYAPKSISQIIAHKTEVQVLNFWLKNFESYFVHKSQKSIPRPADLKSQKQKRLYFECKKFRAVLLSGIAGIGKTSAAHLACKENGYDVLEWNASDVRSKLKIQEEIGELTGNTTMDYFVGEKKKDKKYGKVAIILDEVDGMSGGDRGGIQEIIKLIKETKVPIICICNDVRKRNIVTLTKHCLQLPFSRPRKDIVQKYISKICALEGFRIDDDILLQIIEALRNDIRCVLNNLQFMSLNKLNAEKNAEMIRKGAEQLNVFQVADSIFRLRDEERTINAIMNRYFFDPSLIPLFIQENYINMRRSAWTPEERCERISEAADWLSLSDVAETKLRGEQDWSLAPFHAVASTAAPTFHCHGGFEKLLATDQHLIRFPSALGKGSTTRKNESFITLLRNNCSSTLQASKSDITLEYVPMWNTHISTELSREPPRIGEVVQFMDAYGISREDLDGISDIHTLKDTLRVSADFKRVSSLVKRKLTASYKETSHQVTVATFLRRQKLGFSKESILDEEANQNEIFQDETKESSDQEEELDSKLVEKVDPKKLAAEAKKAATKSKRAPSAGRKTKNAS